MIRFLAISNLAVIESAVGRVRTRRSTSSPARPAPASRSSSSAVGLLLGGRASADLVRTGEDTATVEAIFETADGRRARRPPRESPPRAAAAPSSTASSPPPRRSAPLVGALVELHGQHEHQALLDPATHLPLLDALGRPRRPTRAAVRQRWDGDERGRARRWRAAELDAGERARPARAGRLPARRAAQGRLVAGRGRRPRAQRRDVLRHADRLQHAVRRGLRRCSTTRRRAALGHPGAGLEAGGRAGRHRRRRSRRTSPRATAIKAQLEDLAPDAPRLRGRARRLARRACRRSRTGWRCSSGSSASTGPTLADVLARTAALEQRARRPRPAARAQRDAARGRRSTQARAHFLDARPARLSTARRMPRRARSPRPSRRELADLAMAGTRFEVRLATERRPAAGWHAGGIDHGEFFLAAEPRRGRRGRWPASPRAASCRASCWPSRPSAPATSPGRTLIFDEVDAGIGGRDGRRWSGEKLRSLGERDPGAVHHPPAARSPRRPPRTSPSPSASTGPRTVTTVDPARRRRRANARSPG